MWPRCRCRIGVGPRVHPVPRVRRDPARPVPRAHRRDRLGAPTAQAHPDRPRVRDHRIGSGLSAPGDVAPVRPCHPGPTPCRARRPADRGEPPGDPVADRGRPDHRGACRPDAEHGASRSGGGRAHVPRDAAPDDAGAMGTAAGSADHVDRFCSSPPRHPRPQPVPGGRRDHPPAFLHHGTGGGIASPSARAGWVRQYSPTPVST